MTEAEALLELADAVIYTGSAVFVGLVICGTLIGASSSSTRRKESGGYQPRRPKDGPPRPTLPPRKP